MQLQRPRQGHRTHYTWSVNTSVQYASAATKSAPTKFQTHTDDMLARVRRVRVRLSSHVETPMTFEVKSSAPVTTTRSRPTGKARPVLGVHGSKGECGWGCVSQVSSGQNYGENVESRMASLMWRRDH